LAVLSQNPLKVKPEKIRDIKVEMTMVGGKVVYSASD
jgi:predicted amidohydrolase YtcJ